MLDNSAEEGLAPVDLLKCSFMHCPSPSSSCMVHAVVKSAVESSNTVVSSKRSYVHRAELQGAAACAVHIATISQFFSTENVKQCF